MTNHSVELNLLLSAIVEGFEESIISVDGGNVITSWNPSAERLYGYPAQEVLGKPLTMLSLSDDLQEVVARLDKVRSGATVELFETERLHKDGHRLFLSIKLSPVCDGAGRVVGVSIFARDITERKRAEALLTGQQQVLKKLATGATLVDVLTTLLRAIEEQTAGLLGSILICHPDGGRFEMKVAPSLPESYIEPLCHAPITPPYLGPCGMAAHLGVPVITTDIADDERWPKAWRQSALDHGLHSCYSSPIFSADGKILGSFGLYHREATDPKPPDQLLLHLAGIAIERKRVEYGLQVSEMRYRRLFEAAKDGILILNANTAKITDANPFIAELLGHAHTDLLGKELWQIGLFKDKEESKAAVRELQANHYIRYEDLPLETEAGRRIDVEFVSNVYQEDGEAVIQCNIRDITERKQLANELRQYAADMSEDDRRKNEFLAMLAHELRNPLAPIRNALQIIRLTGGDEQAVKSASVMMERQVGQMVRLVDDLLDVSRISRGTIELRKERIELASSVHNAVEAARSLYKSMNHELTVTLPPQPIYLNADPTRLAQVLGNLLNNACKFTDNGNPIWLTVERDGEQAVIRLRDSGIGIAADELPRIFNMFMQIDTSLERSTSGLGIGLTLVKNLVELHDGTVKVHSAGIGHGSEFIVRLPIMADAPVVPPAPTASEPTSIAACRILVVDDNHDSATSLAMLLKIAGHQTQTAFDGLEAVEAAAKFNPDVVLLDIGLPKLNGYEAARKIREQPWGKGMVLVALTGWGQEEDRQRSRDSGFDAHMVKPVDFVALTTLLAELLLQPR